MRTQKTILNLVYALGSSLLLMLLGFATRRLLVFNFGNDITAASQVVDKLFNFFSIAEFGVGSVISYRLYEQIAAKDTEKISKYMSMYKWAYRAVGVVICVKKKLKSMHAKPFVSAHGRVSFVPLMA